MSAPKLQPQSPRTRWGESPWQIKFTPEAKDVPRAVDVAIVGGGFTGLAAAAWLRHLDRGKTVAVFEAGSVGSGASGRTGGMVLAETAAGDLPGLGDVLAGLRQILAELRVECDLTLPGAWEISRSGWAESKANKSPIEWRDSGALRVAEEVPGGTLDPGRLVSGLARAAQEGGAMIFENAPVASAAWPEADREANIEMTRAGESPHVVLARTVLFATNALSLALSGHDPRMHPRLTLAIRSEPLSEEQLSEIGLREPRPFYTIDLPYLWGRLCRDGSAVCGAGLMEPPASGDLRDVDISASEARRLFASLEDRVRHLHPALADVHFTHRWGGPILFQEGWKPVFARHPRSANAMVLGAYAGHGVALSVYLAAWAAEAILARRDIPGWPPPRNRTL